MAEKTSIEWTRGADGSPGATWNPITGCSVVSPGCTHCYAMGLAGTRLQHHPSRAGLTTPSKAGPVWSGQVRLNEAWLTQPLQWRRPRLIFVCAHGDLFHEAVPDAWIDRVFAVMALCPQHIFQVLTKRSARMRAYLGDTGVVRRIYTAVDKLRYSESPDADCQHRAFARWMTASARDTAWLHEGGAASDLFKRIEPGRAYPSWVRWPLPNVWKGVSAEDQRRADERVPDLLATPAAIRFVSAEPLLGPIDFRYLQPGDPPVEIDALNGTHGVLRPHRGVSRRLDWVICGGESGPGARPMHPDWARSIRDQCAEAGVPFFFKQWGAWQPREWCRDGGTHAMRAFSGQISFQHIQSHPDSIERVGAGPEWSAFALVGKKSAGRLLDGVEHSGMPGGAA